MSKEIVHVVTRLGAEGFPVIDDLSLCLNGQTDSNFRWIILLRPSAHSKYNDLTRELTSYSQLFERTEIFKVSSDNRGEILNFALAHCENGMLVVLDDDDLPLPNFVEVINTNSIATRYQTIIRTLVFSQETRKMIGTSAGIQISTSKGLEVWPREFDLLDHIEFNRTPCMALSFPVARLKSLQLEWDNFLHAVEDWDFLMKCTQEIPVLSTMDVTALYRKLNNIYRSQSVVNPSLLRESEQVVRSRILNMKFKVDGAFVVQKRSIPNQSENKQKYQNLLRTIVHIVVPISIKFPWLHRYLKRLYKFIHFKLKWSLS